MEQNKNFDLAGLVRELEPSDALEFINATLTPQAVADWKNKTKNADLLARYQAEIDGVKATTHSARLAKIAGIKKTYRERGLMIY